MRCRPLLRPEARTGRLAVAVALGLLGGTHCADPVAGPGETLVRREPQAAPAPATTAPAAEEPEKTCGGTARTCEGLTPESACAGQDGCSWQAEACLDAPCPRAASEQACRDQGCRYTTSCSGLAATCLGLNDAASCQRQLGCAWAATEGICSGSPVRCADLGNDPQACTSQRGCQGGAACLPWLIGVCGDVRGESSCRAAARCLWAPAACRGSPTACRDLDLDACSKQAGCSPSGPR